VLTTTVDNIEHIDSESLFGIAVVKIYLQPNASVPRGIAQVTSVSQAILRQLPTGATPPLVLRYSATNVPVLRVGLSGLSEQQLNDLGLNFVRPQFITVPGVSVPYPYGGKQKFVEVDLNYKALQGYGLTPYDVVNTITAQNLTLPSGTEKIGHFEYLVGLNSSPDTLSKLNAIPIKSLANGTTIYIRDVANIVNGSIPQTNIVRFNGQRATMLDIQKTDSASTLDIVKGIRDIIPNLKQTLPPTLNVSMLSDQSVFVTGAIDGVVREAVIAACLTAIMILLFLGDWKSTLIIAISIPLAILSSIAVLSAIGETLNIMTLGGLALAVGILVDDATVTIENIDRHLAEGKPTLEAIRDGAAQIAVPALVSTMCICIVFVPIFFLSGVAKYHDPTNKFIETIRVRMQHDFVGIGVWFPPADMVAQILNFGLPAPIDVQIIGTDQEANFQFANNLMNQIRQIPGAVDFRIQEPNNAPELDITMDRTKASILGINAQSVANTVLGALAGSQQNALNFWVDPTNGVSYQVNAQVPQPDVNSLDALRNLPILGGTGQGQILANVAPISRSNTFPVIDHYNNGISR
jgi:multidrug efflux pump subunit AcrB